jgi:hypothetical protein
VKSVHILTCDRRYLKVPEFGPNIALDDAFEGAGARTVPPLDMFGKVAIEHVADRWCGTERLAFARWIAAVDRYRLRDTLCHRARGVRRDLAVLADREPA